MKGKNFLTLSDFNKEEFKTILDKAIEIKSEFKSGKKTPILDNKTLAMIFEKPSNRTRVSFEVGMLQLGGNPIVIKPEELQMGKREPIADIAKVLSRYIDGVMMRVMRHTDLVEFSKFSDVPVINGLSDLFHPCQAVADLLTIYESKNCKNIKNLSEIKVCYIGDGNNVCNSLINACNLVDIKITVSCPEGFEPIIDKEKYSIVRDPKEAVKNCDVVYTDVWVSMGEENAREKQKAFDGYCVNKEVMSNAKKDAIFLHCLPAHREEEVSAEVVDGKQSVVFDQAENRMHAQKAILALLM